MSIEKFDLTINQFLPVYVCTFLIPAGARATPLIQRSIEVVGVIIPGL